MYWLSWYVNSQAWNKWNSKKRKRGITPKKMKKENNSEKKWKFEKSKRYRFEIFTYRYLCNNFSLLCWKMKSLGRRQTNKHTNKKTKNKHTYRVETEEPFFNFKIFYFRFQKMIATVSQESPSLKNYLEDEL